MRNYPPDTTSPPLPRHIIPDVSNTTLTPVKIKVPCRSASRGVVDNTLQLFFSDSPSIGEGVAYGTTLTR